MPGKRRRPTTSKRERHLLVDGYNVIHAWPQTRKAMQSGWQAATTRLAEELRKIHDMEGIRVTMVFDGNGDDISIDQPTDEPTFCFLYTPAGTSADEIMEQIVANSSKPENITVATRDNMITESISLRGAHCLTPQGLADWVHGCADRQSTAVRNRNKEIDKQFRNSIRF